VSNNENVALTSGELIVNGILNVHDIEASVVPLTMRDNTNTTHVTTTSDHGNGASVELDEVGNLSSVQIDLDGVIDSDDGIRVADSVKKNPSAFNPHLTETCQPRLGPTADRWQLTFAHHA
jgi:hypothetical protein